MSGLLWSALSRVGQQAVQFAIAILLARMLTPEEFGLIAMITVFTGFAAFFSEMGFGAAIIQRQDIEQRHLSSIFWLNVAAGLILTAIVMALAPFIGYFYGNPILIPLTLAISLNFAIGSLKVVQNALITKNLDFKRMTTIEILAISVAGAIAAGMAIKGFGPWSLVANSLSATIVSVAAIWYVSDWRPQFVWDWRAIKELLGFSANLTGGRVINYWTQNIDNMLIGRYLGAIPLGAYDRAFGLMMRPQYEVAAVLSNVMFPALSIIQNDKRRIKEIVLKAGRAIALVTFPMMMGLLVVARPFVLTLYGEKWEGAILILQIFCLDGMGRSLWSTAGWIYLTQARTDLLFRWLLLAGVVKIASIIIGLHWGAVGVAAAIVLSGYIILWYPSWAIPGRLIDLTFREVLRNVAPIFSCSAAMALAVALVGLLLPTMWPPWARLAAQVPLGMALYTILLRSFRIQAYSEAKKLAIEQWNMRYKARGVAVIEQDQIH